MKNQLLNAVPADRIGPQGYLIFSGPQILPAAIPTEADAPLARPAAVPPAAGTSYS